MKQKPSIQWYQQDFLGSLDVQMMSVEEVGCYCLLLFNCYNNGGALPNDPEKLKALCRGNAIALPVLKKFYKDGEFLRHKRIDEELEKKAKFSKQQSKNAQSRWNKGKNNGMPSHSHGNPDAMPPRQCSSTSTSTSTSYKINNKSKNINPTYTKLMKYLSGLMGVKVAQYKTGMYRKKYSDAVIEKSLKNSSCIGEQGFIKCCESYKKESKK